MAIHVAPKTCFLWKCVFSILLICNKHLTTGSMWSNMWQNKASFSSVFRPSCTHYFPFWSKSPNESSFPHQILGTFRVLCKPGGSVGRYDEARGPSEALLVLTPCLPPWPGTVPQWPTCRLSKYTKSAWNTPNNTPKVLVTIIRVCDQNVAMICDIMCQVTGEWWCPKDGKICQWYQLKP